MTHQTGTEAPANIAAPQPSPRPGAKCSVAVAIDAVRVDDTDLARRLSNICDGRDHEYPTAADASALIESMGFKMSPAIIRRHRRRLTGRGEKCWCPA